MSANVYENPTLTRNMRFIRGENLKPDGEKVERVVDIYESGDAAFTARKHQRPTRQPGPGGLDPPPVVHRNPLRVLTLVLALLCLLLVAAVSVILYKFYLLRRINESRSEAQETRYLNLSDSFCVSRDNSSDSWARFGCRCYFRFTDLRNWSESRVDCVRKGGDLVSINTRDEDEFLKKLNGLEASWVGLWAVEVKWREWRWKWSDGSAGEHLSWGVNENILPTENATVYMNKGGKLFQTTGEKLRGRICEREINTEFVFVT